MVRSEGGSDSKLQRDAVAIRGSIVAAMLKRNVKVQSCRYSDSQIQTHHGHGNQVVSVVLVYDHGLKVIKR